MASLVVNLDDQRELRRGSSALLCECGSAWFELIGWPSSPRGSAVVTLAADGRVTGYSGQLRCSECGELPGDR